VEERAAFIFSVEILIGSILKKEAAGLSETVNFYQTSQRNSPEHSDSWINYYDKFVE
jgi:hypothetical protein